MTETKIFGIRHHGPGSARALRDALESFKPDAILIEGPPEADDLIALAGDSEMVPPVALLAYVPGGGAGRGGAGGGGGGRDRAGSGGGGRGGSGGHDGGAAGSGPDGGAREEERAHDEHERRAAFWPFAEFSPEWQAIRYGVGAGISVRFCDLPAAHQLAGGSDDHGPADAGPNAETDIGAETDVGAETQAGASAEAAAEAEAVRLDPLAKLARAAGYDDPERWWDDVMEHRYTGQDAPADGAGGVSSPFDAIAEAMTVLREHTPPMPAAHRLLEARREAYMRRTLRRTLREGYERVAVVCGAWHVPAIEAALRPSRGGPGGRTTAGATAGLTAGATAGQDDRTLRGLAKVKVAVTWVPWTHGRLAGDSGYGAGVVSPGWYHHLFTAPDRPIERWLTEAARVLRDEDLPVSSAHVIEAVRLAETLAALRDRPLAGLDEVTEATRAVLCEGAELPLALIQRRLVVGERLGAVPARTPMVPLQRDLQAQQRRLRLRPSALETEHDLDLRKPGDLDRSRLLHRLRLLGIDWGAPSSDGRASKGTFRETWTLAWQPEFDVEAIEASAWGTTVHDAATAKAQALAVHATGLSELTSLVERCLLAGLSGALPDVMRRLSDLAAADTDVAHLMEALPALVRSLRYGDVRGTSTGDLQTVVDGLVIRICIGLPPATSGLDDDAARDLLERVDAVQAALALLASGTDRGGGAGVASVHLDRWYGTLLSVVDRYGPEGSHRAQGLHGAQGGLHGLHGLLEGRLTRLLFDAGRLGDTPPGGISDRMARAVSIGQPPARSAAWIEGFLAGGGLVLVHDEVLLRLVDGWISGLSPDSFTDVLPLLRRTFAGYEAPERRSIGDRVRRLDTVGAPTATSVDADRPDAERAAPAMRTVERILGWETTP